MLIELFGDGIIPGGQKQPVGLHQGDAKVWATSGLAN